MFRHISVVVAAIVSLTCAASAATMRNFKVGDWIAGAFSSDSTREFSHCAATGTYRSGISVIFAINRNFHWSMGFVHPSWTLRPGAVFDIAFTVDEMQPIMAKARALNAMAVEVDLEDSSELFARFRRGQVLRVAAASQVFSFNLTGTSQLLPSLLTCAANRGAATQMAANPFETKPGKSSGSNPSADPNTKAEAMAVAANLLAAAGIQGFTLLGPNEHPEFPGDARWMLGDDTMGAINVFPTAPQKELKSLPAWLIGRGAEACKGTFFSGAIPDDDASSLARVFTMCQVGNDGYTVYYLGAPRRAGGVYLITTMSRGSEKPAKETDTQLRSVVLKALAH